MPRALRHDRRRRDERGRGREFLATPFGISRATAFRDGLDLPRAGSFQDAVLRELDFRDRTLRMVETTLHARLATRALLTLEDLAALLAGEKDPQAHAARQERLKASVDDLLETYASELYQDHYAPGAQALRRARSRRKKEEALAAARERQSALAKVDRFGDDPAPPLPGRAPLPPMIANDPGAKPRRRA